ncbi:MAG: c-type cytochrome [Fidelibacterota bacterium]
MRRGPVDARGFGFALVFVALVLTTDISSTEQSTSPHPVTPVTGPGWIKRIGIARPSQTAMGQMGGRASPLRSTEKELRIINDIFSRYRAHRLTVSRLTEETFSLTGEDLYRLNCQSCHGPDGNGRPPEIKSLLDPVRGASPTLIRKRMEERGRPIDQDFAQELAADADRALRRRLQQGGERMPPFAHLRDDEVESLLQYLKELAGVPVQERKEIVVPQSVARIGEHLVKGTCQICHDATGPGGGHMAMMRGITPSLASFPRDLSARQMIRRVRVGSSSMMGMMMGQMMPEFPYLAKEEILAGYLYLLTYPPRP